ncbi:MAG: hypothetical protein AAFU79_17205 [Myxococcota bacterium]
MNRIIPTSALTTLIALTFAADAQAEGRKQPFRSKARVQTVELEGYGHVREVMRERGDSQSVRFQAEHVRIGRDTLVVFEVRAESGEKHTPRWRCVAVESTRECFEGPRRFTWQPNDERMVLSVVTEDRRSPMGAKLFAEALRSRRSDEVAAGE